MFLLLTARNPSTNQQILPPKKKSSFTNSENTQAVSAQLNQKLRRQRTKSNCAINHICMCIYTGEDLGGIAFSVRAFWLVEGFFNF